MRVQRLATISLVMGLLFSSVAVFGRRQLSDTLHSLGLSQFIISQNFFGLAGNIFVLKMKIIFKNS
jgi:hypothetical protein